MLEVKGNIWDFHDAGEIICITTNTTCKNKYPMPLVMGKGIALEAKNRFPGIDIDWGLIVRVCPNENKTSYFPFNRLVMFQTKTDWKLPSTIEIIKASLHNLLSLMNTYNIKSVYLPRIGCGNGGLNWEEDIKPIIKNLDDRFIFVSK